MRTVVGIMALILAIFIAESFTTLMGGVIANNGSALRLALLLLLKSPEVVDFALPLALMLGLYFAVIGAREENELIACAAAGNSWFGVPAFAVGVGFSGFVISLVFIGIITPASSYLMRLSVYDMESRNIVKQILEPGPRSFNRTVQGRTVIATPTTDPDAERGNLYIFQEDDNQSWQFDQADDWTVIQPDLDEGLRVRFKSFRRYFGAPADDVALDTTDNDFNSDIAGVAKIRVSTVEFDFQLEQLLPVYDRTRNGNELLLFGMFDTATGAFDLTTPTRKFAEAMARALLCPIAALFALAGAAWAGTRTGRYAALPVTTISVLVFDVLARALIGDATAYGVGAFWITLFAAVIAALLIPVTYLAIRGETIILPGRNRA